MGRWLMRVGYGTVFALGVLVMVPCAAIEEVVFVNPDMKDRIKGRSYQSRDGTYKLRVPDLGRKVFVKDQDISPGITVLAQFLSDELGALFVVSTRIRDDLPKDDNILDRVAPRYQRLASITPPVFSDKYGTGKHGRTYEFTLVNARAGGSYPIDVTYASAPSVQTLASHRFVVTAGYLYEFALIMHTRGTMQGQSADQLREKAAFLLNEALETFVPNAAHEPPNTALQPTR